MLGPGPAKGKKEKSFGGNPNRKLLFAKLGEWRSKDWMKDALSLKIKIKKRNPSNYSTVPLPIKKGKKERKQMTIFFLASFGKQEER